MMETNQESDLIKRDTLPESQDGQQATSHAEGQESTPEQKRAMVIASILFILIIGAFVTGIIFLLRQEVGDVARIRDIFIILLAIQSLFIGFALVILMVQLARLFNLLQNEIKPILDSTNETVSNLRGTTTFLSNNLVEPVIKLNEYMAGFSQFMQVIGLMRRPSKKQPPKGV